MTPVNLLTESVSNLWLLGYGIIAGWGASFTIIVAIMIIFTAKLIKMNHKIKQLENRLITAERDYNLTINEWISK